MSADTSSPTFVSPWPFGLPRLRGVPAAAAAFSAGADVPCGSRTAQHLLPGSGAVTLLQGRQARCRALPGPPSCRRKGGASAPSWLHVEAAWKVLGLESQHRLDPLPARSCFQPCSCPLGPAGSLGAPTPGRGGWGVVPGAGRGEAGQRRGPEGSEATRAGRRRAVRPRARVS